MMPKVVECESNATMVMVMAIEEDMRCQNFGVGILLSFHDLTDEFSDCQSIYARPRVYMGRVLQ